MELDGGFCFKRFLRGTGGQYFRPGRAGYGDDRSCENGPSTPTAAKRLGASRRALDEPGCHRSLYSYQLRTALALAVEQSHLAVTSCRWPAPGRASRPACSAAAGRRLSLGARRRNCSGTSPAQFGELKDFLAAARKQNPLRSLDMVLLTVGANDVNFAGLVANVIVDGTTERVLLRQGGSIASAQDTQKLLDGDLPDAFAQLRTALKPLVGGNLSARRVRLLWQSGDAGGEPALPGRTRRPRRASGLRRRCRAAARRGRLRRHQVLAEDQNAGDLRRRQELPRSVDRPHDLYRRAPGGLRPARHVRARAERSGVRSRLLFADRQQFEADLAKAADEPMACGRAASDYRPYASRARWIRTANDSYFTAMTYPEGMPAMLKPSDIHDAIWGVLSAVYGGAVHPTAEGYAAMADAAMPAARGVLGLPTPAAVRSEPLPPPAPAVTDPIPGAAAVPAPGAPAASH